MKWGRVKCCSAMGFGGSRSLQILLLILACGAYFWFQVWTAGHHLNSNDFKHIYLGMKALLDGTSPYSFNALHHQAALQGYHRISLNPYVYLPFTGQAMAFLAPFRLDAAVLVWFFLNHGFLGISLWILSGLWPRWRLGALAVLVAAMAGNFALFRTLTAGQLNLALLFMICLSWKLQRDNRGVAAGALMAVAALYKLMPGIFLLYFLLHRRWRAAATMAATGFVLLGISTLLAGWRVTADFLPELRQMSYGKSTWPKVFSFWDDPPNQSLNSFFTHVMARNDHTQPWVILSQGWANAATVFATALLFLVYVWAVLLSLRREAWLAGNPQRDAVSAADCAWSATLILGLLIPSLMWDHYLVMLVLPVAILVKAAGQMHRVAAGIVVCICYGATAVPWNFESPAWRAGAGILLMSLKLWPTMLLFGLSLCFGGWLAVAATSRRRGNSGSFDVNISNPETSKSR